MMELLKENPGIAGFIIGVIVTLILVWLWSMISEHYLGEVSKETAYLYGVQSSPPAEFGSAAENMKVNTRVLNKRPLATDPDQAASNPRFFAMAMHDSSSSASAPSIAKDDGIPGVADDAEKDNKATEHLLTRGGARRAVLDSNRNRYLGMAALGATDYEGYVYQGQAVSDEQGILSSTVYGVNESPWVAN